MPRADIQIEDANRRLIPFELALDDKGLPLWTSHLLPPVHISIYAQSEEARYANLLPNVGSVYNQDELDGGLGKRIQVHHEDPQFNRYYYGDWLDASVRGQTQKGPGVVTLTAPANSGPLSGFFTLAGVPYLVLGRRIASWASDALTAVSDYGAGIAGAQAAVFSKMASQATLETNLTTSTTVTLTSADDRLAESFRLAGTGVHFLSQVQVLLTRVGAMTGDVRLSIQADFNGNPSDVIITSVSMLASQVPTVATAMTFVFDDTKTMALPYNVPLWLVLDCSGATAAITMAWSCTNNSQPYGSGKLVQSTDRGNTWAAVNTVANGYFVVKGKVDTTTAFIGTSTGGQAFKTTTDGATFTPDTYRFSQNFCVVSNLLVRSIQDGSASSSMGLLETSLDGVNWNSDAIVVGDPSVPITNLLTLGEVVIVCKEDGIYAVDILAVPIDVQALYGSNRATTNGVGACVWTGGGANAAYIPFNGRLMAVTGDTGTGFVVYQSVGIEALQEWDWPWGQGRHVACIGSRFHLYSVVSTSGGYRLLKSANPLRKRSDGVPDPEWHGALATIGDGTQSVTMMAVHDPGGAGSPQLFCTTTSNNIARVQLPRSFNPAADSAYVYDTSTTADLFFPNANGNYPVHPKAWMFETTTFLLKTAGDYIEMQYDTLDGEGWRRMPGGGRLYDTGALRYPRGLVSRVLKRRLRLANSLSTASPLLYSFGVSYAMRHVAGSAMREISFTVLAEDGLSAADLGEMLGIGAASERALLVEAAGTGLGSRRLEDPYGRVWDSVLFLDATEVLQQTGRDSGGRTQIQVSAISFGP